MKRGGEESQPERGKDRWKTFPRRMETKGALGGIRKAPVKRTKRVSACDQCRGDKKKCEGTIPCQRCVSLDKQCSYNSGKRSSGPSGVQHFSPVLIAPLAVRLPLITEQELTRATDLRRYFDLFNQSVNTTQLAFGTEQFDLLSHSSSFSKQLQYFSILAIAFRTFGSPDSHLQFEHGARHRASLVFDDVSLETAKGFHLLANFYFGQDEEKARLYRDMALGMCKRLRERLFEDQEEVTRLQLTTICLTGPNDLTTFRDLQSYDCEYGDLSVTKPMSQVVCEKDSVLTTPELYTKTQLLATIARLIPSQPPFSLLSEEHYLGLLGLLNNVIRIIQTHFVPREPVHLGVCIGMALSGAVHCAGGQMNLAIQCIETIITAFKSRSDFFLTWETLV